MEFFCLIKQKDHKRTKGQNSHFEGLLFSMDFPPSQMIFAIQCTCFEHVQDNICLFNLLFVFYMLIVSMLKTQRYFRTNTTSQVREPRLLLENPSYLNNEWERVYNWEPKVFHCFINVQFTNICPHRMIFVNWIQD